MNKQGYPIDLEINETVYLPQIPGNIIIRVENNIEPIRHINIDDITRENEDNKSKLLCLIIIITLYTVGGIILFW